MSGKVTVYKCGKRLDPKASAPKAKDKDKSKKDAKRPEVETHVTSKD